MVNLTREVKVSQFGSAIRRARRQLGLSQPWVAEKGGVSVPMVAQIEAGKKEPSVATGIKIVNALVGQALGGKVKVIRLVGATRDGRPQFEVEWNKGRRKYRQRKTSSRPLINTLGIGQSLGVSEKVELSLSAEVLTLAMEGVEAREGPPKAVKDIARRVKEGL